MSESSGQEDLSKPRLGVSACLLGQEVRYNGGHKHMPFLTSVLSNYIKWVPVCPEVEVGMGVPRETIHLEGDASHSRLIAPKSGIDHTDAMRSWSDKRLDDLEKLDLHGYVFKKDSPTCGLLRVRVFNVETGIPSREGRGIFAKALTDRMPLLPVEEEGRLNDLPLRENFLERVFFYFRWRKMMMDDPTPAGLVKFHTGIKMSVLAHSPKHYREMGQLVANAGTAVWEDLTKAYGEKMMDGLQVMCTPGKHVNVLMHLMGFVKNMLTSVDKEELLNVFEYYSQRLVPLIVPITLLKHHLNRNDVPDWVHDQVYLNPYPMELMLRNHV